jgi:hypothetical protein
MVTIKPTVWGMALIPVIVNCFFQAQWDRALRLRRHQNRARNPHEAKNSTYHDIIKLDLECATLIVSDYSGGDYADLRVPMPSMLPSI